VNNDDTFDFPQAWQTLTSMADGRKIFSLLFVKLAFVPVQESDLEMKYGTNAAKLELLAFRVFSHFDKSVATLPTNDQIALAYELIEREWNSNWVTSLKRDMASPDSSPEEAILRFATIQAQVVRGNAYPFQTIDRIVGVLGQFDEWYEKKIGLSPSRMVAFVEALQRQTNEGMNLARRQAVAYGDECKKLWKTKAGKQSLEPFIAQAPSAGQARFRACQIKFQNAYLGLLPKVSTLLVQCPMTARESNAIKALFGIGDGCPDMPKLVQDMIHRPLCFLDSDSVLATDYSNVLDQIWSKFEEIAKEDAKFYGSDFGKARSSWMQNSIAETFQGIFDVDSIFESLSYPDPTKPGGTTEIDVIVWWDPYLLLIELKSNQFRFEGQLGAKGKLRTDLVRNIQDAYGQALRAMSYIESVDQPKFVEIDKRKRTLVIDKKRVEKTFLLTISLNHLAGLATKLAALRPLGMFKSGTYPWAACLSDLETIAKFIQGPDEFLHYVDRRLWWQDTYANLEGDEMDLFGAYLNFRLRPDHLGKDYDKASMISLGGFHSAVDDAIIRTQCGVEPREVALSVPVEVKNILDELRSRKNDPNARAIAFKILGMDNRSHRALSEMYRSLKSQTNIAPGRFRRAVNALDESVVTMIVAQNAHPVERREHLKAKVAIEKYRHKKTVSFGISVETSSEKVFEDFVILTGDWQHDLVFEGVLKSDGDARPAPGSAKIGRNDNCPCGSGKKFKKCHLGIW